jgi:hypothetical protein
MGGLDMTDFSTMSPILGFLIAVAGLALAVLLGMALYKDDRQEQAPAEESLKLHEEGRPV